MALDVDLAWIDRWLRDSAPATLAGLRPGITPQEVADLTDHIGMELHQDVVTLLRWHNGCDQTHDGFQVWPGFTYNGSAEIARDWSTQDDLKAEYPDIDWQPAWVPIASNWGTAHLVVDHSGAEPSGTVFIAEFSSGPLPLASLGTPTVTEMVRQIVESLNQQTPLATCVPSTQGGVLSWRPVEGN
jgi:hypothetical protein